MDSYHFPWVVFPLRSVWHCILNDGMIVKFIAMKI